MREYASWGGIDSDHEAVIPVHWRSDVPDLSGEAKTMLPFGNGRSYGDSCLNSGGVLLDTLPLSRLIAFDRDRGILSSEAGVTLDDLLQVITPAGWFLPVTPGTRHATIGGCIANDVHGKNHPRAGTFGAHVLEIELLRSSGERFAVSLEQHPDLFRATVGGLGLTGLILSATLQLQRIASPYVASQSIPFSTLGELELLAAEYSGSEHRAAWLDCAAEGTASRGIFTKGDFVSQPFAAEPLKARGVLSIPVVPPFSPLSAPTIRLFNQAYFLALSRRSAPALLFYDEFFYPLDQLGHWNRLYGSSGLLQYQCVVPEWSQLVELLAAVGRARSTSFLAVVKWFGDAPSPGLLSFPRRGITLTLDFAGSSARSEPELFSRLDELVVESGGACYPAKDARMSSASFRNFFPRWREFEKHVDPKFSSNFWRRVTDATV